MRTPTLVVALEKGGSTSVDAIDGCPCRLGRFAAPDAAVRRRCPAPPSFRCHCRNSFADSTPTPSLPTHSLPRHFLANVPLPTFLPRRRSSELICYFSQGVQQPFIYTPHFSFQTAQPGNEILTPSLGPSGWSALVAVNNELSQLRSLVGAIAWPFALRPILAIYLFLDSITKDFMRP